MDMHAGMDKTAEGGPGESRGLVFDIRRFCTHDGPGIRTTVFLKGCPLRCIWCQNPEGLKTERQLFLYRSKCIRCGKCIAACPKGALSWRDAAPPEEWRVQIDRKVCVQCGRCVSVCPPQALVFDSKWMTVSEVLEEVRKDEPFYDEEGGVTLSGGDPAMQPAFAEALLAAFRGAGLHTAMESSLQLRPDALTRWMPHLNLLLADLKLAEPDAHRRLTGSDNRLVLENLRMALAHPLRGAGLEVLVRVPLIPGFTATEKNLRGIGRILSGMAKETGRAVRVELLNYNPLAESKYALLDMEWACSEYRTPFSKAAMAEFRELVQAEGVEAVEPGG